MVQTENEGLLPHSPEAERGVIGCCLLDPGKIASALKAGVNHGCFYDRRHREVFNVLTWMAADGGGDALSGQGLPGD